MLLQMSLLEEAVRLQKKKSADTDLTPGRGSAAPADSEELQLRELVNQEAALSAEIMLKVFHSDIIEYTYKWNGEDGVAMNAEVILQSRIDTQHCLGVAKTLKTIRLRSRKRLISGIKEPHGSSQGLFLPPRSRVLFTLHVAS